MKFPSITTASDAAAGLVLLSLAMLPQQAAAMFQCDHVVVDNQKFDLSALDGAHSVVMSRDEGASFLNTTYTVDICRPLKKKGDVPKDQECPNGSRGMSNVAIQGVQLLTLFPSTLYTDSPSIIQSAPSNER